MANIPEELFRFSVKDIARLCQVSERTVQRWLDATRCPPAPAIILLRALLEADLGLFDPAWSGWVVKRGKLCSPENWIATPGEVRALQMLEAHIQAQRHEIFQLRDKIAELERTAPWLEEQPLPEAWDVQIG